MEISAFRKQLAEGCGEVEHDLVVNKYGDYKAIEQSFAGTILLHEGTHSLSLRIGDRLTAYAKSVYSISGCMGLPVYS